MNISIYKNRYGTKPVGTTTIDDYLENVKSGAWQDFVLAVRNGKADKADAEGVTASALFDANRQADKMKEHSGFIGIDIDAQDNEDLETKRKLLESDPHCYACHFSIRGFGLVWYTKVTPSKHKDAFYAIEKYLANTYGVIVDPSGKDVSRFRFISYDPDLYLNRNSKKWNTYIPKAEKPVLSVTANAFHDDDMGYIMQQISDKGINIADDYDAWLKIGFSLAAYFGEQGRSYFHVISSASDKYDKSKCDRQYDVSVRRNGDGIGIATFFWYCQQAGIETKTAETLRIEMIAKQRLKSNRDRTDAINSTNEFLSVMEGLPEERYKDIVEAVADIPLAKLKSEKVDDKAQEMEIFLKQFNLRFNEVSGHYELDGRNITTRDYNTIYRKAKHALSDTVSQRSLEAVIQSDLTPNYNPFIEFLNGAKDYNGKGAISEVIASLDTEMTDEYLETFLTKWMVSIIASMQGTYSLMVLVLVGGEHGTGKTNFFRELLPLPLRGYYAESKLDKGNDDGILMCEKLLIMDDEFSGKNKKEAAKFKEIASRDYFTVRRPYGKVNEELKRYAVLCGTSNEDEILNDPTGNRRLIPINIKRVDLERFRAVDKTELFYELYQKWVEIGNEWMLSREDIKFLNESTKANEFVSDEENLLLKWFSPASDSHPKAEFLTRSDINARITSRVKLQVNNYRLSGALKKNGFVQKTKKVGSSTMRVFCVKDNYEYAGSGSDLFDEPLTDEQKNF